MDGGLTKYQQLFRAEHGDIVVNKIWARNGSVAVVDDSLAGCHGSNEFPMFAPLQGRLDPRWMHWVTKTQDFWAQCDQKSQGTSGQNRIKPERFLEVEIPLPLLDEQRRIVARIEELAAKVEVARELRSLSVDEVTALGNSQANAIFGRTEYQTRPLGDVCLLITDGTHQTPRYVDDGAIFLSAQNVKPFRFMPEVHRKVSREDFAMYTARNKPVRGDILLTRVGAGIGEAAIIDQDIEFAIYVSVALLRPNLTYLTPEFLVHWLNSPIGRSHSRSNTLGRGHSQGNLNLNLLRSFPVPIPPIERQQQIVTELDALQAKIDAVKALQTEIAAELDAMLPAILDKAFKGKL
ncbi:MAG: restriction endonuclease subunit S [Hyphomicrobium sp.]|nr:restriction endonuclease subunit S [Hyphomicrobium sp.]